MIKRLVIFFNTRSFRHKLKKRGKNVMVHYRNRLEGLNNVEIGDNFTAMEGLWLGTYSQYESYQYNPQIIIGNDVHLSRNCHIGAINKITISDNVLIGSNVLINDHSHGESFDYSLPRNKLPLVSKGEIFIGENCFIGDNTCILSGVTIGKNCVIGANSVVNKSFPDNCIIAGNPAKIVKRLEDK